MLRRQVGCQRLHNGSLVTPDLESHWLTERLAFLSRSLTTDAVYRRKVERAFLCLKSNPEAVVGQGVKHRISSNKAFCKLPVSNDLSRSQKELYRDQVEDSVSDPRGLSREDVHSQWNWVRVSWTIPNFRSPGALPRMYCLLPTGLSRQAWQTCLIAPAGAENWKKQPSAPSTTASGFAHFGITSESGQPASVPDS